MGRVCAADGTAGWAGLHPARAAILVIIQTRSVHLNFDFITNSPYDETEDARFHLVLQATFQTQTLEALQSIYAKMHVWVASSPRIP
jgi:hypothetical protein